MAKSLSDFWRIDRSDDPVMEYVSVLEGANTIVGLVGAKCQAYWSGQSYQDPKKKLIALNRTPLDNLEAPFNGRAVDVVIGFALHEAGEEVWSIQEEPYIVAQRERLTPYLGYEQRDMLKEVCSILGDNFIDQQLSKKSAARNEYIRTARGYFVSDKTKALVEATCLIEKPLISDLLGLWTAISLYSQDLPAEISPKVKEAISYLVGKTIQYVQKKDKLPRLKMAVEVFQYLWDNFPTGRTEILLPAPAPAPGEEEETAPSIVSPGEGADTEETEEREEDVETDRLPVGEKDEEKEKEEEAGYEENEEGEKEDEADKTIAASLTGGVEPGHLADLDELWKKAVNNKKTLDTDTIKEIDEAVSSQRQDLTQELMDEGIRLGYGEKVRIQNATFDESTYLQARSRVSDEIAKTIQAFKIKETIDARYLTGMYSGKLDTRRLSRVGCDKYNIFRRKELKEKPSMAVTFLMDCSGSMDGYMDTVADSAVVFAEAMARKQNTYYEVITYTEGGHYGENIALYRLASSSMRKICLKKLIASGGTPSGEAIASALLLLQHRPEKQKLIVHFTDGYPSSGASVSRVVEKCRDKGIQVRTIGAGWFSTSNLERQYGAGNFETIESVRELPRAVGELTRRL